MATLKSKLRNVTISIMQRSAFTKWFTVGTALSSACGIEPNLIPLSHVGECSGPIAECNSKRDGLELPCFCSHDNNELIVRCEDGAWASISACGPNTSGILRSDFYGENGSEVSSGFSDSLLSAGGTVVVGNRVFRTEVTVDSGHDSGIDASVDSGNKPDGGPSDGSNRDGSFRDSGSSERDGSLDSGTMDATYSLDANYVDAGGHDGGYDAGRREDGGVYDAGPGRYDGGLDAGTVCRPVTRNNCTSFIHETGTKTIPLGEGGHLTDPDWNSMDLGTIETLRPYFMLGGSGRPALIDGRHAPLLNTTTFFDVHDGSAYQIKCAVMVAGAPQLENGNPVLSRFNATYAMWFEDGRLLVAAPAGTELPVTHRIRLPFYRPHGVDNMVLLAVSPPQISSDRIQLEGGSITLGKELAGGNLLTRGESIDFQYGRVTVVDFVDDSRVIVDVENKLDCSVERYILTLQNLRTVGGANDFEVSMFAHAIRLLDSEWRVSISLFEWPEDVVQLTNRSTVTPGNEAEAAMIWQREGNHTYLLSIATIFPHSPSGTVSLGEGESLGMPLLGYNFSLGNVDVDFAGQTMILSVSGEECRD